MRLKSGPRLAVFDIDGTLVDSREVIHGAALAAFAALSLTPPSYDQVRHIVGLNLDVGLAMIAPDLSPAGLFELESHYKAAFHDFHRQPGFIEPLYDGAAETLEHLRKEGWRLSMATGKSRRGVEMVMAMHGWQDLFETTHCADDGPGKPHPAMILAAMKVRCPGKPDDTRFAAQAAWGCRAGRLTTLPCSTSTIASARASVLARWVIISTVRFWT